MFIQKIIVVSRCLKVKKGKALFHFKGFLLGKRVNEIHLSLQEAGEIFCHETFLIGQDYILYLMEGVLEDGILTGKLEKCKKLSELTTNF